jgi:mannose/fructose/N-acetylgalactosamine-specific phosphotransferase system component IID
LFGATRLGSFVLGGLVTSLVSLALPGNGSLQIGAASLALQTRLLDALVPGVLPLAVTLVLWWLLRYRRLNANVLLGGCLVAALLGGLLALALGWV